MSTKSKNRSFNWKKFSTNINKLFEFFTRYSRLPINADRWEEFIYIVLRDMGEKYKGGLPRWDIGSHAPGADIWIDRFSISAKSGSIKNDFITLSSNRLTRFELHEEMIQYIDGAGKNFDFYLCCARSQNKKKVNYSVFLIKPNVFKASSLKWEETFKKKDGLSSGWRGEGRNGICVEIIRKMSNQLWITIPLKKCTKISEFEISIDKLGATPIPYLK